MSPPKRSPLFWILLALGGTCALCCLGTMGVMALGVVASEPSPQERSEAAGEYLPAGEVGRGQAPGPWDLEKNTISVDLQRL